MSNTNFEEKKFCFFTDFPARPETNKLASEGNCSSLFERCLPQLVHVCEGEIFVLFRENCDINAKFTYEYFIFSSDFPTGAETNKVVSEGNCAFSERSILQEEEYKSQRHEGKSLYNQFNYVHQNNGWGILKSSPYKPIFERNLLRMSQYGILDKINFQFVAQKLNEQEVLEPLKLEHFYIIMLILASGKLISLSIFGMEFLFKK